MKCGGMVVCVVVCLCSCSAESEMKREKRSEVLQEEEEGSLGVHI